MDATQPARDRIMSPVQGRLSAATDQVQRGMVKAHATGRPVPALDRSSARLIATMRASARTTVAQTPGLETQDVKAALDWRIAKIKALSQIVKSSDNPPLGVLVALAQQSAKFGSDLQARVSDTLVTEQTQQQQAKCGPKEVLIWQPERNACVRCLKYAGQYRSADGEFEAGQSFDPQAPRPDGKLPGPPLHPNCRCELAVIPKAVADDNAKALQREAQRSILKGWALESEGGAVRTRAAQALLNSNVIAPKSVIAETRRRLKSGQPFIQDVPAVTDRSVKAPAPAKLSLSPAARVAELAGTKPSSVRKLSGGESARTELVGYPDGSKLVHKVHGAPGEAASDARRMADAEVLGAAVLDAVGLRSAAVHKAGPRETYAEFVDGKLGAELMSDPFQPPPAKILRGDDGKKLGLADLLMSNQDRNPGNWITDRDDRLVGIDHGAAFGGQVTNSPFARSLVNDTGRATVAQRNDWAPADLERLRERLAGLEPLFEDAGRRGWHTKMMARLAQLERGARGTAERIT